MKCIWATLSNSLRWYNLCCRSLIRFRLCFIVFRIHVSELSHCFYFPLLATAFRSFSEVSKELWMYLTVCVPVASVVAFLRIHACVCVCEWMKEYVKGETKVPLMACVVRSEMDGRCSTWELLFSHTVSFSLHSHPSSLPWCLPLPAASSGRANQGLGHKFLFPSTQNKNTSSSLRGRFFLNKKRERKKKRPKIRLLVSVTFY